MQMGARLAGLNVKLSSLSREVELYLSKKAYENPNIVQSRMVVAT